MTFSRLCHQNKLPHNVNFEPVSMSFQSAMEKSRNDSIKDDNNIKQHISFIDIHFALTLSNRTKAERPLRLDFATGTG